MAFEKKRPERETFLKDIPTLARMSDRQFNNEVAYWRGIRDIGGDVQIATANFMLGVVLSNADLCRQSVRASAATRAKLPDMTPLFEEAIAGLALSRLIQSSAQPFMEDAFFESGGFAALEGVVEEDSPLVAQMHVAHDRVHEVLSVFDPHLPLTWYADEEAGLAVRAKHPAMATQTLEQRFLIVTGNEFQSEQYVTLRPFLLNSFVEAG